MGLNRCNVCEAVTTEPDTAFCSDKCCDSWTAKARVELEALQAQMIREARLVEDAVQAALDAHRTGLWN